MTPNNSKTLLHIVGTRPNIIKLGPIHAELAGVGGLQQAILQTGQHYDPALATELFEDFSLPSPDFDLQVGKLKPASQFASVVEGVSQVIEDLSPDLVLIYGDVRSTAAAAIAAYHCGVLTAHYEAGQRAHHRALPEEMNRIVADVFSDILLAAEKEAVANIELLGMQDMEVSVVGSLMCDAARMMAEKLEQTAKEDKNDEKSYAVFTCHRQASVDEKEDLLKVVEIIEAAAKRLEVRFPVHPRTHKRLTETGLLDRLEGNSAVRLFPALRYSEFMAMLKNAQLIVSDSGGIVAEGTYFGIPHVYLRDRCEHRAALDAGSVICVSLDVAAFNAALDRVLNGEVKFKCPDIWDGQASGRIRPILCEAMGLSD